MNYLARPKHGKIKMDVKETERETESLQWIELAQDKRGKC